MRIGIDGRLWNQTGVGRYIRSLVHYLGQIDTLNDYVLFLEKKDFSEIKIDNKRWQKKLADVTWHTLEEQIRMPRLYQEANVDLVHLPYFSVPLYTPKPFIVTIHDLTISHFATGKATTKPLFTYLVKRLGYKIVLGQAIKNASCVIAVSETVKKQILKEYKLVPTKVEVTYESGELEKDVVEKSIHAPSVYILYVGNAHPHKNLNQLIEAFARLTPQYKNLHLVLIGKTDFFYERLRRLVVEKNLANRILFIGSVTNSQLKAWYKKAHVFVFPSLSEGFGIPGLEAMGQGCPVACSDISVFHEIYGEAAYYIEQRDSQAIVRTIEKLLSDELLRKELVEKGFQKAREYSWKKMAEETLAIYESSLGVRPRQ